MTLPLVMYGSYTCEDTAFVRDRLHKLRVHFKQAMKEDDERVGAVLKKYNSGLMQTPTLVFGNEQIVITEPTIEELEDALTKAGYSIKPPSADVLRLHSYAPDMTKLPAHRYDVLARHPLEHPTKYIVFFAHSEGCRVCQGYAKQLSLRARDFRKLGTHLRMVLHTDIKSTEDWARDYVPGVEVRADEDGSVKREFANFLPDDLGARPGGTWLLILDRNEVPRIGIYGGDAGSLVSATEIIAQLKTF
ncbi:MAG: redoxin domain-containing protein [Chloroflexi bacterium]|nr:redoxin domain-containing protein [Chloroflexota bacterium]